jgi:hypothetical protein
MNKHPDSADREAVALLSPLAGDPAGQSRIDVAGAMAEGRRRRRTRWWTSGLAVVAVTATTAAGGTLAFPALGRPTPPPPRPTVTASPSTAVAAPPAGPKDCTVSRLPTAGIEKALVTGGDASGRWHVGRLYPPGGGQGRPLVVWRDGKIVSQIRVGGDDDSFADINSRGQAVGSGFDPEIRPYAYRDGKVKPLAGGEGKPQRLPLPAGAESGDAGDIDEAGNVLGTITPKGKEGTGYLWLADGTTRRMPLPEVGGRKATMFWPAAIRDGWVVGRAVIDTADSRSFAFFRYRIASNSYERLVAGAGMPARVAANGWVVGEADRPVITVGTRNTKLPAYPKLKGEQQYIVESVSDDGLVVAGYSSGPDTENHPAALALPLARLARRQRDGPAGADRLAGRGQDRHHLGAEGQVQRRRRATVRRADQGVHRPAEGLHRQPRHRRHVGDAGLAEERRVLAFQGGRGVDGQRQRADRAARVPQQHVRHVAVAGQRGDLRNRAQHGQDQRDRVRADVPQAAALLAPHRRPERVAGLEDRAEVVDPRLQPATGAADLVDELLDLRHEPAGEEDHPGHLLLGRGRDDLGGGLGGEGDRLVQQQVLARLGRAQGDVRLHVRGQRDRDRVHVGDQGVDLRVGRRAVLLGQRGRLGRVPAPHTHELDVRVRRQRRGVRLVGPRSRTEKSEPHPRAAFPLEITPGRKLTRCR